jgi:hypothetical protein
MLDCSIHGVVVGLKRARAVARLSPWAARADDDDVIVSGIAEEWASRLDDPATSHLSADLMSTYGIKPDRQG